MNKHIASAFLFLAALPLGFALAQVVIQPGKGAAGSNGLNGTSDGGAAMPLASYQTTGHLYLCVDPSGDDVNNSCTGGYGTCCATIPGARNKVPKLVKHPVIISIDAGVYGGDAFQGFVFDPESNDAGAYIWVRGALDTVNNGDGGTTVGMASAGTAGSTNTFGTLTQMSDGGAGWTTNALKGYVVEVTSGTGSGQFKPIVSNTASTIKIAGLWTAPASGSTFAIRDWQAHVTTSVLQSALPNNTAAGTAQGFYVGQMGTDRVGLGSAGPATVFFDRLDISPTAGSGLYVTGASTYVGTGLCKIAPTAANTVGIVAGSAAGVNIVNSVIQGTLEAVALGSTVNGTATAITSVFRNNLIEASQAGNLVFSGGATGLTLFNNQFNSLVASGGVGVLYFPGGVWGVQINGNVIQCVGASQVQTIGIELVSNTTQNGPISFQYTSGAINNCTIGVQINGANAPAAVTMSASTAINETYQAIVASQGAHVYLTSNDTFTGPLDGGTETDITMDGNQTYSLATIVGYSDGGSTLVGGTIPMVSNTYGTSISR